MLQKLNYIIRPLFTKWFIGADKKIAEVESLLFNVRPDDVCMIGLYGMGSVSKTTIAKILFEKYRSQSMFHCFIENVREKCGRFETNYVQNELETHSMDRFPVIRIGLYSDCPPQNKKIMIVLDDVSDSQQLEYLIRNKNQFASGSKIIVTTRDKGVFHDEFNVLYNLMPLDNDEAHQLFCLNVFNQDQPKSKFIYQIDMAVDYAKGNPLPPKVLGLYLHSKNTREWESALQKLKKSPYEGIHKALRLSCDDGLDFKEKNTLLDVSTFLKGDKK